MKIVISTDAFSSMSDIVNYLAPSYAPPLLRWACPIIMPWALRDAGHDAGFDPADASPEQAAAHTDAAILIIHAAGDTFVPPSHAVRNLQECEGRASFGDPSGRRAQHRLGWRDGRSGMDRSQAVAGGASGRKPHPSGRDGRHERGKTLTSWNGTRIRQRYARVFSAHFMNTTGRQWGIVQSACAAAVLRSRVRLPSANASILPTRLTPRKRSLCAIYGRSPSRCSTSPSSPTSTSGHSSASP